MSLQEQKVMAESIVDIHRDALQKSESNHPVQTSNTDLSLSSAPHMENNRNPKVTKAMNALHSKPEVPQGAVNDVINEVVSEGDPTAAQATPENGRQALEQLKTTHAVKGKTGPGGVNRKDMGEHKFWATQLVPQWSEEPPIVDGHVEPPPPLEEVSREAFPLPKDFEWTTLDINDPKEIKEIHDLLSLNYVEDDAALFRFHYSSEFLQWALKTPGYFEEWHLGVRVSSNKKLVAFISGIPITLRVRENIFLACEINFLCVHKKLRSKRLAPVLIKEITRQVKLKEISRAIYTTGVVIPTPVSMCRYYHRLLNVLKLIDIKFCDVTRSMTRARMVRVNKVATNSSLPGLREMEDSDIDQVSDLFARYMKRFDMVQIFSLEEVRHLFLSGKGTGAIGDGLGGPKRRQGQVVWAYVVENPETRKITDFFTFYSLPSTVVNNTKHPTLQTAYLYYYATETAFEGDAEGGELKKRLETLIGDALFVANEAMFDVFYAMTLMDNESFLQDLKFGAGEGVLNFYLYNWRTAPLAGMNPEGDVPAGRGIGIVML